VSVKIQISVSGTNGPGVPMGIPNDFGGCFDKITILSYNGLLSFHLKQMNHEKL
jgi:hypothetical protein